MISGRPRLLAVGIPELHRAAAEDAEKALGRWSDFGSLQTQVDAHIGCIGQEAHVFGPLNDYNSLHGWVGQQKVLTFSLPLKRWKPEKRHPSRTFADKSQAKPVPRQDRSRSWRGSQANHMDRSRPFGCGFQANQILAMDDLTQVGSMQNKMHLHRRGAKLSRGGTTCSGGRLVGGTSNAVSATLHPWARLGCQMVKHCGASFPTWELRAPLVDNSHSPDKQTEPKLGNIKLGLWPLGQAR